VCRQVGLLVGLEKVALSGRGQKPKRAQIMRNPATVRQRHHQFICGESNRDGPDLADINFQRGHAI